MDSKLKCVFALPPWFQFPGQEQQLNNLEIRPSAMEILTFIMFIIGLTMIIILGIPMIVTPSSTISFNIVMFITCIILVLIILSCMSFFNN